MTVCQGAGLAPTAPVVVGLDVSLTATGVASSRGWSDVIGTQAVTTLPMPSRVHAVDRLVHAIDGATGSPDLVVIELPAYSRTAGASLERAALWWLVVRGLVRRGRPVAFVYPRSRMKYATGKGAASKAAIVDAVARRLPQYATAGDDNVADAVILCAMGADWLGHPLATMPQAHREALQAVAWPDMPCTWAPGQEVRS